MKNLLEKRVGTLFQQKWVAKLPGFDFTVEYRCGKENRVVDALSQRLTEESSPEVEEATPAEGTGP